MYLCFAWSFKRIYIRVGGFLKLLLRPIKKTLPGVTTTHQGLLIDFMVKLAFAKSMSNIKNSFWKNCGNTKSLCLLVGVGMEARLIYKKPEVK